VRTAPGFPAAEGYEENPEIVHNIQAASEYTRTLRAPTYALMFPNHASRDEAFLPLVVVILVNLAMTGLSFTGSP
jgi:hypothetical protein